MDGIDEGVFRCGEDRRNLPADKGSGRSRRVGCSSWIRSCEAPVVRGLLLMMNAGEMGYSTWLCLP